jgi:hypothetical protein
MTNAEQHISKLREMSAAMAEDDGLWFQAETCAEAYLQQELRKLCAAIESPGWAEHVAALAKFVREVADDRDDRASPGLKAKAEALMRNFEGYAQ